MDSETKNDCITLPRAEMIARLNDRVRKTGAGGMIVLTPGVRVLAEFTPAELLRALCNYDRFDRENDPHGERDFGDLELFGADLLWKIDYYDREMRYGSNDPADAGQTARVLTVMLAGEY